MEVGACTPGCFVVASGSSKLVLFIIAPYCIVPLGTDCKRACRNMHLQQKLGGHKRPGGYQSCPLRGKFRFRMSVRL